MTIRCGGDVVSSSTCASELGVQINSNLTIAQHVDYVISKATRTLFAVRRSITAVGGPD